MSASDAGKRAKGFLWSKLMATSVGGNRRARKLHRAELCRIAHFICAYLSMARFEVVEQRRTCPFPAGVASNVVMREQILRDMGACT